MMTLKASVPIERVYNGPETAAEHQARQTDADLWVFAYGSLMWRPGFDFVESAPALLDGWHRDFCILSIRYRGTPEQPGLVLGLDDGGQCHGIAYRIRAEDRPQAADYLDRRELATRSYLPRFFDVTLADGRVVSAYGYVCDHDHPQYAGRESLDARIALIAKGHGKEGPCRDYLANTVAQLHGIGMRDPLLEDMLEKVDRFPA